MSLDAIHMYETNRNASGDACILLVDGVPCPHVQMSRGICQHHQAVLRDIGRYEEFARKKVPGTGRYRIELKPIELRDPELCRVRVNGIDCPKQGGRRGLCLGHYQSIWQRPDLRLDDFCRSENDRAASISKRKTIVGTQCRVREAGQDCTEAPHARGLCKRHYAWLRLHAPGSFAAIAEPDPSKRVISLRQRQREGRCRVAENSVGCGEEAAYRGLCEHHYNVLHGHPELLAAIAEPPKTARKVDLSKREDATTTECVVAENGQACPHPAVHRGLCARHKGILGSHPVYKRSDFMRPITVATLRRKTSLEAIDGLCRAVLGEVPCRQEPFSHGLCRNHLRLAERRKCLNSLLEPMGGDGQPLMHVYLDKNILFDYLDYIDQGRSAQMSSVDLVNEVIAGRVRASLSMDALKSAYNRIRYRHLRSGGIDSKGQEPELEAEAERIGRSHIERLLGMGGTWHIVTLDAISFVKSVNDSSRTLSLEDSLEWSTYQLARTRPKGPQVFVTRDADFSEGIRPNRVLMALAQSVISQPHASR